MSSTPTVYLGKSPILQPFLSPTRVLLILAVTGANRGIGLTLVQQLSARPNTVVFAGARSLPSADSQLGELAAKSPKVVIPLVINSANEKDNTAAAEVVKSKAGKVDVLIANAGQ
jgi:norsolorinic acid ketoreductase